LLVAGSLPWLTVRVPEIGERHLTMFDIYSNIARVLERASSAPSRELPEFRWQDGRGLTDFISSGFGQSIVGFILSIIAYALAILAAIVGVFTRKSTLASGIIALVSGGAWIFAIENLKSGIISAAGGLEGQLLRAIMEAFMVGVGAYACIAIGVILILGGVLSQRGGEVGVLATESEKIR